MREYIYDAVLRIDESGEPSFTILQDKYLIISFSFTCLNGASSFRFLRIVGILK